MKKVLVIKGGNFAANSVTRIDLFEDGWNFIIPQTNLELAPVNGEWFIDGTARALIRGNVVTKVRINSSASGSMEIYKCVFSNSDSHVVSSKELITTLSIDEGVNIYDIPPTLIGANESIGFREGGGTRIYYSLTVSGEPFSTMDNATEAVQFPDFSINIGVLLG